MRLLVALSVVIFCLQSQPQQAHLAPSHDHIKGTAPKKAATDSEEKQQPEPVVKDEKPESKPDHGETQNEEKPNRHPSVHSDTVAAYSAAIIAVFTLVTTGAFLYQIRIFRNSERAWIGITKIEPQEQLYWVQFPPNWGVLTLTQYFKVRGRTPARITEIYSRFCIVRRIEDLPKIPEYRTGDRIGPQHVPPDGLIVPPEEEFHIVTEFDELDGRKAPTVEQITSVRQHAATLVYYGVIRYRDAFNRKHETRFCYVFDPALRNPDSPSVGRFVIGEPSAYNKTT
jgi:hypothetical protein